MNEANRKFWNDRAGLGASSGTHDTNLKQIEIRTVLGNVPFRSSVLDVGCGDGSTLVQLALRNQCCGVGVDFSENMVEHAKINAVDAGVHRKVDFVVGVVPGFDPGLGQFSCALTERCLINLGSADEQYTALKEILSFVCPDGVYLMLEHSRQGLDGVNALRAEFGLDLIAQPWHNLYLDENLVYEWEQELYADGVAEIETELWPASTYYLLSRVVHAKMAADDGTEPDYNSIINQIAVRLPSFGQFGYSRLWVWRKF